MVSQRYTHSSLESPTKRRLHQPAHQTSARLAGQTYSAAISHQNTRDSSSLTPRDVLQLQRTIGNQAVRQVMAAKTQGPLAPHHLPQVIQQEAVIQRWKSEYYEGDIPDDHWLVVLVNENTSWHGHTDLIIQGSDKGQSWYQTLSYQPEEKVQSTIPPHATRDLTGSEKATGRRNSGGYVPGRVVQLTGHGSTSANIPGKIAEGKTVILITQAQGQALQGLIERDKQNPPPYAAFGHPRNWLDDKKRENCHSWAVGILQEAGIDVPTTVSAISAPAAVGGCVVQ